MSEITALGFLHLLLLVYWLGADLGVFYAGRYVVDPHCSVEARQVAARIMFWLDQAPRICMTLTLPVGIHLADAMGYISIAAWQLGLIWLVCLLWLINVNAIHLLRPGKPKTRLTMLDLGFRVVLMTGLIFIAVYSLLGGALVENKMIAVKLLVFALLIACGLLIRLFLRPFASAFADLARRGATDAGNTIMSASIRRCRYVVVLLWLGLLFNAALGMRLIII